MYFLKLALQIIPLNSLPLKRTLQFAMELTVHYNSTDLNQTMIVSIPPNAEVDQSSHVSYTCFMILFINFLYVFIVKRL